MPLIIHKIDPSPPVRSVLMIAEILKLKYETREVNIMAGDNLTPEYIAKNPQHTVPLLEDGDFVLADSHAIITYLVSKYGADKRAELYPSDLAIRATIDHRLYFDATVLFSAARAIIRSILHDKATGPSEKQIAEIQEAYGILEIFLSKTKFLACDHITLADVSCVATVSTSEVVVPIDEKFEKLRAWLKKLKNQEWYQKANVPGLSQITEFISGLIAKNSA